MRSVATTILTLLAVLSTAGCAHKTPAPVADLQPIKDVKSDDRRSELGITVPELHSDTVVLVSTLDHTLQPRGTTPVYPPKTVTPTAPIHPRISTSRVSESGHTAPTIQLPADIGQPRDDAQKLRDINQPSNQNLTPVRVTPGAKTSSVQPQLTPESVQVASNKQKITDVPNFQPIAPPQNAAPAPAPTIQSGTSANVLPIAESSAAASTPPVTLESPVVSNQKNTQTTISEGMPSLSVTPAATTPPAAVELSTITQPAPSTAYHKVVPIIEKHPAETLATSATSDVSTKESPITKPATVVTIPVAPPSSPSPITQTNAVDSSGKPVVVASNIKSTGKDDAEHLDKLWAAYCDQGDISFEDEMRLTRLPIPEKFRGNCFPPK